MLTRFWTPWIFMRGLIAWGAAACVAMDWGVAVLRAGESPPERAAKPRVIVLTDISNEPDDEESMVRFLVYSNEYDVEGLIATTSVWLKDRVRPDLIRRQIEAYGEVRENLLRHARGFPTVERLLAVTKAGRPEFGMAGVGEGKASEGSRHIVDVVDRADDRPVWVTVWGGANCLAQALRDVRASRSSDETETFIAKLRVYTISDQDDSGPWLRSSFPTLAYIVSPSTVDWREYYKATWTGISGDRHYRNGPRHRFELVDNPWLAENVIESHGPLGALYPKLTYIMEGDTPSFLSLIGNGLEAHQSPDWGGWGGRYELYQCYGETRPIWTNSRDTVRAEDGSVHTTAQATIWRWREAFQHDFAARMDWCVADAYEKANHNPRVILNGIAGLAAVRITARPGERLELSAEGTIDPDGDELSYAWFHYPEAGPFARNRPRLELRGAESQRISFAAPDVAGPEAFHIILAVADDGAPRLTSYRRAILDVRR